MNIWRIHSINRYSVAAKRFWSTIMNSLMVSITYLWVHMALLKQWMFVNPQPNVIVYPAGYEGEILPSLFGDSLNSADIFSTKDTR